MFYKFIVQLNTSLIYFPRQLAFTVKSRRKKKKRRRRRRKKRIHMEPKGEAGDDRSLEVREMIIFETRATFGVKSTY